MPVVRPVPTLPFPHRFFLDVSRCGKESECLADQRDFFTCRRFYLATESFQGRSVLFRAAPLSGKVARPFNQIFGKNSIHQFHPEMPFDLHIDFGWIGSLLLASDHFFPNLLNFSLEGTHESFDFRRRQRRRADDGAVGVIARPVVGEDLQIVAVHLFPDRRSRKGGQKVIAVQGSQARGKLNGFTKRIRCLSGKADDKGGVGDDPRLSAQRYCFS